MEIKSETKKPVYESDIREWNGRPVDLGLYWLTCYEGGDWRYLSHPNFIVPQDLPQGEYARFVEWAIAELMKKNGLDKS